MILPALMLAILALVVMRALMGVVAHDDAAPAPQPFTSEKPAFPVPHLRARADDGVRAFLLPAAEPGLVEDATRSTGSQQSAPR